MVKTLAFLFMIIVWGGTSAFAAEWKVTKTLPDITGKVDILVRGPKTLPNAPLDSFGEPLRLQLVYHCREDVWFVSGNEAFLPDDGEFWDDGELFRWRYSIDGKVKKSVIVATKSIGYNYATITSSSGFDIRFAEDVFSLEIRHFGEGRRVWHFDMSDFDIELCP